MRQSERSTRERILEAGRREFLRSGFRGASLRAIAREAGVTTGAFYGYYASKEALFDALVSEVEMAFLGKFNEAQSRFAELPPELQPSHMGEISGDCMDWMVDYIYAHFEEFWLLLCCAEGTRHERFLHTLVEIETEGTHKFLEVLGELGHETPHIDPQLEHILVSGFFSGFFEIVVHRMPKEEALGYVRALRDFYTAGWQKIMGLSAL